MRILGLVMAVFGGGAALFNLMMGSGHTYSLFPLLFWGGVCIVGIIIFATHPHAKTGGK